MLQHQNEKDITWRILDEKQLRRIIPLSRSTIWRMEQRGKFPKRFSITPGRVGWYAPEIETWIVSRATQAKVESLPKNSNR